MDLHFGLELKFIFVHVIFYFIGKINANDDFSFLNSKLASFQAHACDGEELSLTCTPSTVISVQFVQYGRQSTSVEICPGQKPYYDTCNVQDAIKVVQAKCHTGKECRILMSPKDFPNDPCRGVRKYAEVMYKCRPDMFFNKIVCENNYLNLRCETGQVIIILSAFFGTTKKEVIDCPQEEDVATTDCHINYVDQTVDRICSGRQNCSLKADTFTFGDPMCTGKKHLKVTYSCVEKSVLVKPSSSVAPIDDSIQTTSFPAWFRGKDQSSMHHQNYQWPRNYVVKSTQSSPSYKSEMQSDEVPIDDKIGDTSDDRKVVKFVSGWMSAKKYVEGNKDKLILYVTISLAVGFLCFVTVLASRFVIMRMDRRTPPDNVIHITPETEDQFFSDSDLEQYDPAESLPPPMINYTASMRRKDSEAIPRAPVNTGQDLNHYFS